MSGVAKRGRMSEEGRSIIQVNFNFLINELLPDVVASELFTRFILTQEDLERINAEEKQSGRTAAAKKLLSILEYCGNNSYNEFLEALKKTGFSAAVTKLQQTVVRPSEDPFAWLQNLSSEKSQMPLKENHLSGLAGYFAQNWEAVSFKLGCTQAQISQAILNNPSSVFMQIFTTLNKWKQKNASQATLIELLNAMKDCSHATIIDWVGVKKYVDEL